ncbi:MAG: cell surface protein [Planctomycetota bacterium]
MNKTSILIKYSLSRIILWMLMSLTLAAPANGAKAPQDNGQYLSPLALAADKKGKILYVAQHTAKQVAVFNIGTGKVTKTVSLPDRPNGLVLSPDGSQLYVTCDTTGGKVYQINSKTLKVSNTIAAGHTPLSPAIGPNGKKLYVCNRFNNNLSVIDLAANKEIKRIPVTREPVAAALTPDGNLLLVANHLPAGPADADYTAAVISAIDTKSEKLIATIELPNGSTGLRGVCISPDGKHAYLTHLLARYQLPTTQLERGWMNTNALSVIDVAQRKLVNTVLLDDANLGAANPWAVACTPNGKYICVSHAGTHEISVIDRTGLLDKLTKTETPADVPNDLTFLATGGLRRRIKLQGNSPRGLCIVKNKVYVAEYFTDSLGVAQINPKTNLQPQSLLLGRKKPLSVERKGEMLFHDAKFCYQQWQSCASCHPDGRSDGLNWDLMNDGIGNPKNVKSMLLAHKTPPAMITGIRPNAEAAVRSGIKHIQFAVLPETDAEAIDEYLKSLKPVVSPYLIDGKMSEAAERGRSLFEQAGCGFCHSAPLYTDLKPYNVGTGKQNEPDRKLDTPTLIEVWRTAPYLYDGRATTIKEVLTRYNIKDTHGSTSKLNEGQIRDLAEFILSQ